MIDSEHYESTERFSQMAIESLTDVGKRIIADDLVLQYLVSSNKYQAFNNSATQQLRSVA